MTKTFSFDAGGAGFSSRAASLDPGCGDALHSSALNLLLYLQLSSGLSDFLGVVSDGPVHFLLLFFLLLVLRDAHDGHDHRDDRDHYYDDNYDDRVVIALRGNVRADAGLRDRSGRTALDALLVVRDVRLRYSVNARLLTAVNAERCVYLLDGGIHSDVRLSLISKQVTSGDASIPARSALEELSGGLILDDAVLI